MLRDEGNDHSQVNSPGSQAALPGRGVHGMEVYPNTGGKWCELEGLKGEGFGGGEGSLLGRRFVYNILFAPSFLM